MRHPVAGVRARYLYSQGDKRALMNNRPFPIIDLAPFRRDDARDRQAVARQIDEACREIGFFGVTGHGVDEAELQECYDQALAFFDLPLEEKLRIRQPALEIVRGYIPQGAGALAAAEEDRPVRPDLKESFTIGPLVAHPIPSKEMAPLRAPNLWPRRPAGLRPAWVRAYLAFEALARHLMHACAMALGLEEHWFDGRMNRHFSVFSALYYPDQHAAPEPGQLRSGAHTDFDALTILRPDRAPGRLQVMTKAGTWAEAPLVPGAFIVNIGDLLARWTNDRWVSTLHRVVNPPGAAARRSRRLSLGYFQEINPEVEVSALPGTVGAGSPAKYPPITAGAIHNEKFMRQANAAVRAAGSAASPPV